MKYNGIARTIAKDQHLLEGESLEDGFRRACNAYGTNAEHSERLLKYLQNGWFAFATPVLANAGSERGLPISCYLNHVSDSRKGILEHYCENAWLTSLGGGIGGSWRSIRSVGQKTSRGLKTSGLLPFLHVVDSEVLAFSQGSTRRGAYAGYIDINHPEIYSFIDMRKPSGGDPNRRNLNLHHGVNITDEFMDRVNDGGEYNLVDPHSGEVVERVNARALWAHLINTRLVTGEPYLYFIDTANRSMPVSQLNQGLRSQGSNLCTEITLPTNEKRTAVCCLSSINAEKYDEWRTNDNFVGDLVEMLDNVLQDFINKAPMISDEFKRAVHSATQERSIGLGLMGFHSYLQSKMIPMDSVMAVSYARNIQKHIMEFAHDKSCSLAEERGGAPDCPERRNTHLIAIAPNATSSFILNCTSPGIEPIVANSYTAKTKTMNFTWRNRQLGKYITDEKVWKQIHADNGSVQNIVGLSDEVKDVFKTAYEINQNWLIDIAAARQSYIDQAQSLNLFFNNDDSIKYISDVHRVAHSKGLKSLYYVRTKSLKRPENIQQKIEREIKEDFDECLSCEG